jgi:hypothetical protein
MKFSATFERVLIDVPAYMRELDRVLRDALAAGIYAYLQRMMEIIPAWSGASRATFLQLASTISFSIPIESNAWGGKLNRIALGEQNGTGQLIIDANSGQYHFEYTNNLHYLTFNEEHNANAGGDPAVFSKLKAPGPYHFQEKCAAAFEDKARYVTLPSPFQHLKFSVLRVGSRTIF